MTGQSLHHYQILDKLGEGGMGVVYKARDTHLDRFVAIKVLTPEKVSDPDRKARFIREAKAASALNHPNIITVHDISTDSGIDFIAMEYVDGKTLDQLIPRKGMRLNEALRLAIQIADALARAHSAGIIHRDLKPANIMVDGHGQVKVLDFGLAKLTERQLGEDESTATAALQTDEDSIVGTAAYMSPEQAEGKPLDARSDIFSFGAVLYETLTGQRAFPGESRLSTLSAVLHKEPAPLMQELPYGMRQVVARCLRKNPNRRFHHCVDLKVALEDLREESESGTLTATQTKPRRRARWLWGGGLLAVALTAGLASILIPRTGVVPLSELAVVALTSLAGQEVYPSFSPDGSQAAFAWTSEGASAWGGGGPQDIYVVIVGAGTTLRLTNSPADDNYPAWSPDGRQIAFLRSQDSQTSLYLVSPLGGRESKLADCRAVPGSALAWAPDGSGLVLSEFNSEGERGLVFLPLNGGERVQLTVSPHPGGFDWQPAFSPDGRTLAYSSGQTVTSCDVHLLPLGRDLRPSEPARRLTNQSTYTRGLAWAPDGRSIIYSASRSASASTYLWRIPVDSSAAPERLEYAGPLAYAPAVSFTGRRLAFVRGKANSDIVRIRNGSQERILSSTLMDNNPQFSPDGRRIAFASNRVGETTEIWVADAEGSNMLQVTRNLGRYQGTPRWSPDGRWIAFDSQGEDGLWDIYIVDAEGGRPRQLTDWSTSEHVPSWSPDGKWIYFSSNRTGKDEIWRMSAGGGDAQQITSRGGYVAFASHDGRSVYYLKSGIAAGGPLFEQSLSGGPERKLIDAVLARSFVVFPDGIYYVAPRASSGIYPIWFYEFASGRSRDAAVLGEAPSWCLTVSPDRKTFVATVFPAADDDIMLVENFR